MQTVKIKIVCYILTAAATALLTGCGKGGMAGYKNDWMYPQDIGSVYVEMFDSGGFRRGYEFKLTDAICKRIEAQTPYKIVSDRDIADSVLSGTVTVSSGVLAGDRYTGRALEQEALIQVRLTWKNLKTGQLMLDNEEVYASASYSGKLGQSIDSSGAAALNKAAQKVVERMETPW